ncbi:MAG: DUF2807 domain-containing protein [Spirochaetales bacterium]|nr:DUF2807 domain-containing protein [Spirochaetales bacterium]
MKIALRIVFSLACLAALASIQACTITRGSGRSITEARSVGGFTNVDLRCIGTVRISFGEKESVEVEAEDNILPLLRTAVEGDTLVIGAVKVDDIHASLSGSGVMELAGGEAKSQDISLSGSGSYKAPAVECNAVIAKVSGSGSVEVRAEKILDAHLSGSGSVRYAGQPQIQSSITGSGRLEPATGE